MILNKGFTIKFNDNHKIKEFFFISSLCIIFLFFNYIFTPKLYPNNPLFNNDWDHHKYIAMSYNLFGRYPAPYAYRIFVPLLVSLIPISHILSFEILNFLGLFLTNLTLYYLLKLDFDKLLSLSGVIIFQSLEFAVRFLIFDFYLADSFAFFFITISFFLIKQKKYLYYSLILFLGVLTKETIIFTIPFFLISLFEKNHQSRNDTQNLKEKLLISLYIVPGLIAFFILRLLIPIDENYEYSYIQLLMDIGIPHILNIINLLYRLSIRPWGLILIILILFNFNHKYIKECFFKNIKYLFFIIMCYLQLLFAVNIERLIIYAFYPMIYFSLLGIDKISNNEKKLEFLFVISMIIYFFLRLKFNDILDSSDPFKFHFFFNISFFSVFIIVKKRLIERRSNRSINSCETGSRDI